MGVGTFESAKEAFQSLKTEDRNLIFEMVYKESGIHSDDWL